MTTTTSERLPSHWAQHDPGPLTTRHRERRIARLEQERANEQRWFDALAAEHHRHLEFLDALIAREHRRPTRKEPA